MDNIKEINRAIATRRDWLTSIAQKRSHIVVSAKWDTYRFSVRNTGMKIDEFEQYLLTNDPDEYHYASIVRNMR